MADIRGCCDNKCATVPRSTRRKIRDQRPVISYSDVRTVTHLLFYVQDKVSCIGTIKYYWGNNVLLYIVYCRSCHILMDLDTSRKSLLKQM